MNKITALILCMIASVSAHAHHSFAAEFDADKEITIVGVVTEVRFRNPHVQYFIDVEEDGVVTRWNVQAQNVVSLRRRGWDRDTLEVGDRITVAGFAGREGAPKIYVDSIVAPDGRKMTMFDESSARTGTYSEPVSVAGGESAIADALVGTWGLDVDKPLPGAPLQLSFMRNGDGLKAVFDNEELDVVVGTDSFSLVLDRENAGGFPARLRLTGRVEGDTIAGPVEMIAGYTNLPNLHATRFTATRTSPERWQRADPAREMPVDFTGIWQRTVGVGPLGRTNPALNETGKARHAEYLKGLYDPALRCMSPGPMRKYADPGLLEIVASTNRFNFLYESNHDVRRIWFDRDAHDAERTPDVMGESIAHWEGSTLVIDTANLTEAVLTHNSEPISNEARITERLWLNDDGELVMEAMLHDPKYYARPVARRTQWRRADGEEMLYTPCDPDSFYRTLHLDGALERYFENQPDSAEQ